MPSQGTFGNDLDWVFQAIWDQYEVTTTAAELRYLMRDEEELTELMGRGVTRDELPSHLSAYYRHKQRNDWNKVGHNKTRDNQNEGGSKAGDNNTCSNQKDDEVIIPDTPPAVFAGRKRRASPENEVEAPAPKRRGPHGQAPVKGPRLSIASWEAALSPELTKNLHTAQRVEDHVFICDHCAWFGATKKALSLHYRGFHGQGRKLHGTRPHYFPDFYKRKEWKCDYCEFSCEKHPNLALHHRAKHWDCIFKHGPPGVTR